MMFNQADAAPHAAAREVTMRALLVGLMAAMLVGPMLAGPALAVTPNPVLYLTRTEPYTANGKAFIRYRFAVFNNSAYPAEMFAAAPSLPPCGTNTSSARSWVDFYDSRGQRLYGFCALGSPAGLDELWFGLEEGVVPPSWVYIEINDRQTGTKYRSNLAETTM
jgi:hypothetical protein